jgi:glutamine synthetase
MADLRATADKLETLVDEKDWPMPNYVDLMFGI